MSSKKSDDNRALTIMWARFPELARRLEEEQGLRAEKVKKRRKPKEQ